MSTTKWILDPIHSELGFKIRHLMIANVSGSFKNFNGEIETENEDFSTAQVNLTAEIASISTNNEQRDAHLRASDFFDVENFPELSFKSTNTEKVDKESFVLHGNLTLKGITKPIKLNVEYNGLTKDPWGGERAGFAVTGKINRSDFGVTFNALLENSGVALGEEVKINCEIEVVKQVVEVAA